MKADEPGNRVRLVKYGLPASDIPQLEARHSVVMLERKAIERAIVHHDLQRLPPVLRLASVPAPAAPPAEVVEDAAEPESLASPAESSVADAAKLLGLRAALGLV